jgi:hypothetical protein
VHRGGVDDDAAGAAGASQLDHLDGDGQVGVPHPTHCCPDRVGSVVGAGRRVDGLVGDDGVEGTGRLERRVRCIEHHRSQVDEDRLEDAAQRLGRDRSVADREPE